MSVLLFSTLGGLNPNYEIHVVWCLADANRALNGELEQAGLPGALPNPVELFNTSLDPGGEVVLCELALENKGIDPRDLCDERTKISKTPPFLMQIEEATRTCVFLILCRSIKIFPA